MCRVMCLNVASTSTIFGSINNVSPVASRVPPSRHPASARDVNQDVQPNTALIRTAFP